MIGWEKKGSSKKLIKIEEETNGHVVRNYETEGDVSGTPVIL